MSFHSRSLLFLLTCFTVSPNDSHTCLFLSIPMSGQDLVARGSAPPSFRGSEVETVLVSCMTTTRVHVSGLPAHCILGFLGWCWHPSEHAAMLLQLGFRGICPDVLGCLLQMLRFEISPYLGVSEILLCEVIALKCYHLWPQQHVVHCLALVKA